MNEIKRNSLKIEWKKILQSNQMTKSIFVVFHILAVARIIVWPNTHTHYWINSNRNTTCLKYWCQEINWYLIHDDIIDQYLCLCLCVYWIIISRFSCVCAIYKWKRDEKKKIFDRHQINVHTNISTSWAKKNKVYLVCIWWALDVNFRGICHI